MPEPTIESLYQQINSLSADAIQCSRKSDFEQSNELLAQRLELLNKLAENLANSEYQSLEYQNYYRFLTELKEDDELELIYLQRERSKVIAENALQKKRTKAVTSYHQVSLDK